MKHTKLWSENLKGRDHLEDFGVGGRIILKRIWVRSCELELSVSGKRPVAGFCEQSNEPLDSIKGGAYIELLSDYKLLKVSDR
jgi:hypothetical protein